VASTKVGGNSAKMTRRAKANGRRLTVTEIVKQRQSELLEIWLTIIRSVKEDRTLELVTEEQLREQATGLLKALQKAFAAEDYEDRASESAMNENAQNRRSNSRREHEGLSVTRDAGMPTTRRQIVFLTVAIRHPWIVGARCKPMTSS